MQAYPRPDWTFRPPSKADFSERSKNVARLLQQPLQKTQEFLARIYGFSDLHALQAEIQRTEADPEHHPPGPFLDAVSAAIYGMRCPQEVAWLEKKGVRFVQPVQRDNHLLSATVEFCFGDLNHLPADRHWDVREIDLFSPLDQHRVSFARVREKWRVLDAADAEEAPVPSDLEASDYAQLEIRPSGRRLLRFTPAGQAVNEACRHLKENLERDLRAADLDSEVYGTGDASKRAAAMTSAYCVALERLENIAESHPRNPWAMASVVSVAVQSGLRTPEYLALASTAFDIFKDLFDGEPNKALPRNDYFGPDVDNSVFHFLLCDAQALARACGKPRLFDKFRALERKIAKHEPVTKEDEWIAALIDLERSRTSARS